MKYGITYIKFCYDVEYMCNIKVKRNKEMKSINLYSDIQLKESSVFQTSPFLSVYICLFTKAG